MEQIIYIIVRGLGIGALISAPMGPIGMLVIQRALGKGRWPAFFTGLGAAVSDLVYCLLTGFCLSFITDFIGTHQLIIQLLGGVVLALFGVFLYRKKPRRSIHTPGVAEAQTYWSDCVTGFLLTFSNPLILFFIIGLFARFSFILPGYGIHHYIIAYLSIFAGAMGWWYGITALVHYLGKRINMRTLKILNRTIGVVLAAMGVAGIVMAFIEI